MAMIEHVDCIKVPNSTKAILIEILLRNKILCGVGTADRRGVGIEGDGGIVLAEFPGTSQGPTTIESGVFLAVFIPIKACIHVSILAW